MAHVLNPYRYGLLQPNLIIGGVGASITTKSLLAAKLSVGESAIRFFEVDAYDTVRAYVNTNYSLITDAFLNDTEITFLHILEDVMGIIGDSTFENSTIKQISSEATHCYGYDAFNTSDLKYLYFSGTNIGGYRQFANTNTRRLYFGNVTIASAVAGGANNPFVGSVQRKIYAPNGYAGMGNVNTFMSYASSYGATIVEVTDFTLPTSASSLAISSYGANYATITFTAGSSANGVDFYEVWVDDGSGYNQIHQEITASGDTVVRLEPSTNYTIKIATCDTYWNGSGLHPDETKRVFSNEVSFTTLASSTDYDDLLLAAYPLENSIYDVTGNYDLSSFGTTSFETIDSFDCIQLYGNDDYLYYPDNDAFTFADGIGNDIAFSFTCWVRHISFDGTNGLWIISKRGSTDNREYQLAVNGAGNLNVVLISPTTSPNAFIGKQIPSLGGASLNDEWQFIGVTYDGSKTSAGVQLYHALKTDTNLTVATTDNETGTYTGMVNGNSDMVMGTRAWDTALAELDGYFHKNYFWKNRVLTPTEMEHLFDQQKIGNDVITI